MRSASVFIAASLIASSGLAQSTNPCDLTGDGKIDFNDFSASVNMTLALTPCSAAVLGEGICDITVVQRVINNLLGSNCVTDATGNPHYALITWAASPTPGVIGYNVYRSNSPVGPYIRLNLTAVGIQSFRDITVVAGQTYYYAVSAVIPGGGESVLSNPPVNVTVPSP